MSRREISSTHAAALRDLPANYWWLAVRRLHVDRALARVPRPFRYLDLGCGTGILMQHFVERFQPADALGIDGTDELLALARERGLSVRHADFGEPIVLPFAPNVITAVDVLEHLEDPVRVLHELASASAPDATLIVTVPAMPSLMSRWDEAAGHHRRYTRASLEKHLKAGGWQPSHVRYLFAWAVPPTWVQRVLLRIVDDVDFPPVSRPLNATLIALGRLEAWLGTPFPFGTSLIAVAQRVPQSDPLESS